MSFFGGIKRTAADAAFSNYIREKARWICERCHVDFSSNKSGLHNSHFYTRGNPRVRFDESNVAALCCGCHDFMGKNPHEHHEFFRRKLGELEYNMLVVRANSRRKEKLDHKFEAIKWRAALKDLRKKAMVIGGKA